MLIASLAVLGFPHSADPHHDADCALGVVVNHDAAAHRMVAGGADADSHTPHCVACHAARSLRPHVPLKDLTAPSTDAVTLFHPHIAACCSTAQVVQPPLRAPPPASSPVV
jgi:hypothetical protein